MKDKEQQKYTVLMAVYCKDIPSQVDEALKSLLEQTIQADEVLIVIDGPIDDSLEGVLSSYENLLPLKYIRLIENKGLANALRIGVLECRNELIGRMDSDDICVINRFEQQLAIINHNDVDIVGGLIVEFNSINEKKTVRNVPELHDKISRVAKYKSPVNHVTVLFKKSKVFLK